MAGACGDQGSHKPSQPRGTLPRGTLPIATFTAITKRIPLLAILSPSRNTMRSNPSSLPFKSSYSRPSAHNTRPRIWSKDCQVAKGPCAKIGTPCDRHMQDPPRFTLSCFWSRLRSQRDVASETGETSGQHISHQPVAFVTLLCSGFVPLPCSVHHLFVYIHKSCDNHIKRKTSYIPRGQISFQPCRCKRCATMPSTRMATCKADTFPLQHLARKCLDS